MHIDAGTAFGFVSGSLREPSTFLGSLMRGSSASDSLSINGMPATLPGER